MINLSKVNQLLKQIEDSPCVIVGDSPYLHSCNILGVAGDSEYEDEEILSFDWADDEDLIYEVKFSEKNLSEAEIDNNVISLIDMEGEKTEIKLYNLEANPIILI